MAWQSTLEQVRSVRLGRKTVIGLGAGILIGLILGLLIGWVWWPVEWEGPPPTAAPAPMVNQFDTPEAKALYLGAVADAYVYASAAGQTDAAAAATQRLAALGGDIRAAFDNAIRYYSAQAGGADRVNNLTTLALAVGIPIGGAAASDATAPQGDGTAAQPAAAPEQTAQAENSDGGGSGAWLALLAAALLVGGGVYLLWTLKQRQTLGEAGDSGFLAEEPAPTGAPVTPAFDRSSLSPVRSGLTPAASIRSTVERPQTSQGGGPHGFESEDIEDYEENDFDGAEESEDEVDARVHSRRTAPSTIDGEYDRDEWEDADGDSNAPDRHTPAGFVTSVGATPPYGGGRSSGDVRQSQAGEEATITSLPSALRTPPPATLQPPTPSRFERYTPVESYTATYYLGQVDFDYTKNVQNPSGSGYIGEYGIGIPEKRGMLNNDLEKVIAIDVYLFDKTDERQLLTVTRSMLSLYADEHNRSEFEREKQSLGPIVAQPGTNFQLEGRQLLLDCQIKQVEYTSEGYFRSLKVELVLKRRN